MGSRDYRHREPKKTKKETRKLPGLTITTTPADVEVIRKSKKREGREEEEET
jgi:hypothetical protein